MSRNIIPVLLTVGFGVFTSYYTFQPALQQLAAERAQGQSSATPGQSGPLNDMGDASTPINNPPAPSSKPEQTKTETGRDN